VGGSVLSGTASEGVAVPALISSVGTGVDTAVGVRREIMIGVLARALVAAGLGVLAGRAVAEGNGALVGWGVVVGTAVGAAGRSPPEQPAREIRTRPRARK